MNKTNKYLLTLISLLSLTALSGALLMSSSVSATSSSASATVHVPDACTLVSTLNTPHTATLSPGTSTGYGNSGGVNGIGQTTLKVTCNDSLGFAIYAIGYTEDTFGNTNLVSNTKNNGVSTYTIATGTNTGGSTSNWAMQINAVSGTFAPTIQNSFDSSSYHNVPTTYTMVAKRTSATMNPSDPSTSNTGSSITTTYAAYISTEQAPDTYTGKVKYTMVHPNNAISPAYQPLAPTDCPANSICYAPNADGIEGTMLGTEFSAVAASPTAGRQTGVSANSTAILRAYNYSRSGYGFAGWSPSYEASTASGSTDIIYGPMATISTNPNDPEGADVSTNGLILYPVWVASTGTMQSFTSSDCNSMSVGDVTARTDVRDGNTYTIAKLVDGKCWMVENLRLNDDANITTSNTQSNNGSFGGVFVGLANQENDNFDSVTTANSLYSIDGSTTKTISGNYAGYRFPRYNNSNIDRSLTASYYTAGNSGHNLYQWYGYGNYYTWPAAVADTTHYSTNNQSITSTSLCPAGWRLPKGGRKSNEANNEFWALIVIGLNNGVKPANYDSSLAPAYSGAEASSVEKALRSYPNNFLYSGQISGSRVNARGNDGVSYYWSSTVFTDYYSWNFMMNSPSLISTGKSTGKYEGNSIRCLADS